jgi:hypothetical protein
VNDQVFLVGGAFVGGFVEGAMVTAAEDAATSLRQPRATAPMSFPVRPIGGSPVAIRVFIYGDKYHVAVSPPEGPNWRSSGPMTATAILKKLGELGCHSTDITDALYAADPRWTQKHDEEVLRRRQRSIG